jgi:hypothetical protein
VNPQVVPEFTAAGQGFPTAHERSLISDSALAHLSSRSLALSEIDYDKENTMHAIWKFAVLGATLGGDLDDWDDWGDN